MTHRERLLAALNFQLPDRVPLDIWIRPELWNDLKTHCGIEDDEQMREFLGLDWRGCGCHIGTIPSFRERLEQQGQEGAAVIFHPDGSQEDMWGMVERPGAGGMYMEWLSGPFKDEPDISRFEFPDFSIIEPVEGIRRRVKALHDAGLPAAGGVSLPFKRCWQQRGLENFMMDMYINADFANALLDWWYAFETERGRRVSEAGADIVTVVGDIGMQDRLMLNPAKWREMCKPRMEKMFRTWKEQRPDNPPFTFYHTDGDVSEIIRDLIEIGLDILNPIQPECMDIEEIGRLYRGKLRFHGAMSIQETLPHGTEEDVRAEVRHRIDHLGPHGGYVLCPANVTQTDTPVRNLLAMYDEARKYSAEAYR